MKLRRPRARANTRERERAKGKESSGEFAPTLDRTNPNRAIMVVTGVLLLLEFDRVSEWEFMRRCKVFSRIFGSEWRRATLPLRSNRSD